MELEYGALSQIDLPLDESLFNENLNLIPQSLEQAIESRKKEFVAGRLCAFRASKKLGLKLNSLEVGSKREPLWPLGIVGSISHTKKMALAIVDSSEHSRSLGIDVEEIIEEKKEATIERMVATKKDLAFLKLFSDKLAVYTVLFSAKEALYKLLYPLCQEFFGFMEAELKALDMERGEFVLKLDSENPKILGFNGVYRGKFFRKDGHIISVIRLAHNSK
ncbi:MAG: enterobactin synthetase component D [Bacteriovoracaceae bacterium]|jgi:enterobactin synthetase component D